MEELDLCEEAEALPAFAARYYQTETDEALERGWAIGLTRQLVVWATGAGKGTLAAILAKKTVGGGKRMLFLAHRESLIRQTAARIIDQLGVETDIEMADERASPYAMVVCASVQSLQSIERLTSFSDDHFDLVVCDESQHSLAAGHQRVMNYFHYGSESLADGWEAPLRGLPYKHKARIVGLTATPDIQGKKTLGDFYEEPLAYDYSLLRGVDDGYLVPPICTSIPLKVDLRGLKATRTSHGSDISDSALSDRLLPYLKELAKQVALLAANRKTVVFVPSVECARLLDGFLREEGMNSSFVSGQCSDPMAKLEAFKQAGIGSVISNAIYVSEGVDIPDISCIVIFRATKSRGFYVQLCGRASRPLPKLVDHLATAEERRDAIRNSAKPNFLILDPLWISDNLQLVQPYNLVTSDQRVADRMAKLGGADLVEMEKEAERDLMSALAKEAHKHAKKKARTMDPLTYGALVHDPEIANYVPSTDWERMKPDAKQLEFLAANKIGAVDSRGLAQALILRHIERERQNLATPGQLSFLRALGYPEEKLPFVKKGQAGAIIGQMTAKRQRERAGGS